MEDTSNPQGDQSASPAGDQGSAPTPPPSDQGAQPAGGAQPPSDQGAQSAGGAQPPAGQGAQPTSGQPTAGRPPAGKPPKDQKDLSGIMEENVDISSLVANAGNQKQQQDFVSSVKIPPHPNTKFDEQNFIKLLAGSISLTITEKKKIIEAIPQLSQFQIDELMKIFTEEQTKFSELEKKHADQMKELEGKHKDSWQDLEAKAEEEKKKGDEEKEAEDIKKSLGL